MSQMVELLESFLLTDGGSIESRLKGVRIFNQHTISPENRLYMIQVFASLPKATRLATWAAGCFNMMPIISA